MSIREILEKHITLHSIRQEHGVFNVAFDDLEQELSDLIESEKGQSYELGYNDAQGEYQISEEQVRKILRENNVFEGRFSKAVKNRLINSLAKAICSLPMNKEIDNG